MKRIWTPEMIYFFIDNKIATPGAARGAFSSMLHESHPIKFGMKFLAKISGGRIFIGNYINTANLANNVQKPRSWTPPQTRTRTSHWQVFSMEVEQHQSNPQTRTRTYHWQRLPMEVEQPKYQSFIGNGLH